MDTGSMLDNIYEGLSFLADEEIAAARKAFEQDRLDLSFDQAMELSSLLDGIKYDLNQIAQIAGGSQ